MSVFRKIGSFFSLQAAEDEEEFFDEPADARRNVVPMSNAARRLGVEVEVFAPKSFGEVTEIGEALRNRRLVIINVQAADRILLQRVIDFTSGVAFTLDGKMQKLAEGIYLVVPAGVNISSPDIRESFGGDSLLDYVNNRGSA